MRRVILVGATDGLGRALAELYASRGYWVTLLGRSPEKLDALVARLRSAHPDATVAGVACDLADARRIEPAFREAIGISGHCDLFVYTAGVMPPGDGETSVAADDRVAFEVNAVAAAEMLGLAANYFRAARKGTIAAVSSIAGDRGRKANPAYCASKAALSAYLEALRHRLHPYGVKVVTVKPGFLGTRMTAGKEGLFWVCPVEEAARIVERKVDAGREVFYVYARWALVALVLRHLPRPLFKRFGPP